jgi:uncharacterized protein
MRRKQCEITDREQVGKVLSGCTIGRMATLGADGYPYITPVNFVWYNEAVYFHSSRTGEKLENIRRDPRVCFEVDIPLSYLDLGSNPEANPCRLHQLYHCVIIRGKAVIVEDREEKAELLNALVRAHEPGVEFTAVTSETPALAACAVVKISPEQLSAKSDLLQGKDARVLDGMSTYLLHRGREMDAETVAAIQGNQNNKSTLNGDTT